jgi:hypothetical protein
VGGHTPQTVQKIRRIPRAFVDKMDADAATRARVDLEEYAAAWLTGQRQLSGLTPVNSGEERE